MAAQNRPDKKQKPLLDDKGSNSTPNSDSSGPERSEEMSGPAEATEATTESAPETEQASSLQGSQGRDENARGAQGIGSESINRGRGQKGKSNSDDAQPVEAIQSHAPTVSPLRRRVPGKKLYQDEIYGTKELSSLAVAIIDTPEFQRLGHIYQLGFTYQAFRGANHRRFDHSVGTFFRVRTLLRRIVQNHARLFSSNEEEFRHPGRWLSPQLYIPAPGTRQEDQSPKSSMGRWRGLVEIVSAAALLHDLGHVPAGHTLEDEFNIIGKHDGLGGARFFQMFYGPRVAKSLTEKPNGPPSVENYFGSIEGGLLPRPAEWERATLPWVFENDVYDRFLVRNPLNPENGLSNSQIRDLIYLILSFKDTSIVDEHQNAYTTFETIIEKDLEKANQELAACKVDDIEKAQNCLKRLRRVELIQSLYRYYSQPQDYDNESKPIFYPFMSDVVGNTICADLLDYLVRDGKRLKLDIRDNPRLERYLVIRPDQSLVLAAPQTATEPEQPPNLRLTIYAVHPTPGKFPRRDTVSDLLDLMRERYRFAEIVYYHPKKAAFSAMLAKAMELVRRDLPPNEWPQDDEQIYPAPWAGVQTTKPWQLAHFGDEGLIQFLADKAEQVPRIKDLCHGINYRSEYRLLFTIDYDTALTTGGVIKFTQDLKPQDGGRGHRVRREEELAELLYRVDLWRPQDAPPLLIYCPSPKMQAKEVEARVELESGRAMSLNRHDSLRDELRMMNEKYQRLWRLYLFVHPRLFADLNDPQQASIVDAFCDLYGISVDLRGRGCRRNYRPLSERVDSYFRDWIESEGLNIWPESVLQFIKEAAADTKFWVDRLGPGLKGHPITKAEYSNGFWHLAHIAAADAADERGREQWRLSPLKLFRGREWYCASDDRTTEKVRLRVREEFKKLVGAAHSGTAAKRPVQKVDWLGFFGSVQTVIRGLPSQSE